MKHKTLLACAIICASAVASSASAASLETATKFVEKSNIKTPKGAAPFSDLIHQYAAQYKVPLSLAYSVIHTESRFNAKAHGKAGEIGLMQLMPATARGLGFKGPLKNLYNPVVNLQYGMRYLSKANQLGKGNICQTILKYNAGYNAKSMNPVSLRYCKNVKRYIAKL